MMKGFLLICGNLFYKQMMKYKKGKYMVHLNVI